MLGMRPCSSAYPAQGKGVKNAERTDLAAGCDLLCRNADGAEMIHTPPGSVFKVRGMASASFLGKRTTPKD